jgi:hypothetical protein
MARSAFDGVAHGIEGIPGLVFGIMNRAVGAIRDMIGAAFKAAASFASGLWNGFKKGLGISSPSFIERAMTQIVDHAGKKTEELKKHVGTMRMLTGSVVANSPAGMRALNQQLATVSASISPIPTSVGRARGGDGASVQHVTYQLNQKTYYPIAEPESRATRRNLDRLAALGPTAATALAGGVR